jgi:ferric-dicitrate binding protein FerR (iron transport regulator)
VDKNSDYTTIDSLIADVLSGNAPAEDCRKLKEWMDANPENLHYFEQARNIWLMAGIAEGKGNFDADAGFQRFMSKVRTKKYSLFFHSNVVWRSLQIAAMLAIVFSFGALSYHYYTKRQEAPLAYYETIVPLGAKSEIVMIDGTKVWLNAGSRLRYSTSFALHDRNVFLEGEGYFEVAHNEKLPFEVKTSMLNVKAIGTSFNVKAYPNDSTIETILVEGKVEVSRLQDNALDKALVFLQPRQRLTLLKNTNEMLFESKPMDETNRNPIPNPDKEPVNKVVPQVKEVPATGNYMITTSWKDKRWSIEGEELESLAVKLERRYNVQIIFADNTLKHYRFTGTLEDEPIEAVLKAMAKVAPVTYEFSGSTFVLSANEKFREQYKKLWQKE